MITDCANNGDRATFSDDRKLRYHLFRRLHERCGMRYDETSRSWCTAGDPARSCIMDVDAGGRHVGEHSDEMREVGKLVTFIMINPSTADAYKPDPTITDIMKRSRYWGCDSLSVVNLFALRTPYPDDLKAADVVARGNDAVNDEQILTSAKRSDLVVCAWGNHGVLDMRGGHVIHVLRGAGVTPHHLGLTKSGHPKHPLARGVHRIPANQMPIVWER